MTIDIGPGATSRSTSNASALYTSIDLANSANADGTLNIVELWFDSSATGVKVGTFYGTAPNFTSRDVATIGSVTGGSKQTFTGLSIQVRNGDYIGIYYASGTIRYDLTGGADVYSKSGDQFGAGSQSYTQYAGDAISAYATGVESGGGFFFFF